MVRNFLMSRSTTVDERCLAGKRCIVLGAGGFLGTNLSLGLAAVGAHVIGYGRRSRVAMEFPGEWIDGAFEDATAIARALAGADTVFHLLGGSNPAASNRNPGRELLDTFGYNLEVIKAASGAGVGKFVFVSSGGTVYGPAAVLPIPETAQTDPISAYGVGKLTVEKTLRLYGLLEELDHIVLRVANPYGPYQLPGRPQGIVATLLQRVLDRQPVEIWGDGSVVRDYVHVADVVAAMIAAARIATHDRVFNIGSGIGRSLNDLVAAAGMVVGRPAEVIYKPARPADIPANVLDCERARVQLEWTPETEFELGLGNTLDWLSHYGLAAR